VSGLAGWWVVASGWLVGWWLAGWLVGWLAGWLVGWLAGWLAGWYSLIGFDVLKRNRVVSFTKLYTIEL
jgi:hypothetical protein